MRASVVVLGDADVVPMPGGRRPSMTGALIPLTIIVLLVILAVFGLRQWKTRSA